MSLSHMRRFRPRGVAFRPPTALPARPSNLIAKVAHILKWFNTHGGKQTPAADGQEATNAKP